jgi:hypothetical protein
LLNSFSALAVSANVTPTNPDVSIIEIIKNLKFMLMVFRAPIKANPRISFYQVKIMLFHGAGRKNSGAHSFSLERR